MRKRSTNEKNALDITNAIGLRAAADVVANGVSKEDAIYGAIEDVCGYCLDELTSFFGSYWETLDWWMENTVGGREFLETLDAEFDEEMSWYQQ